MKIITPPIKSQGIKTKLVPWISQILPKKNGKWIEPFLGTGVVAFNMGFKNALLNDTNPHIIKLYQEIQNGIITPQIVKFYLEKEGEILRNAGDNGYDHFRFIKNRFNKNPNSLDFIFLSRAGFNGMMRFNKKGEWNIPFCKKPERFAQPYITKIVNQVAKVSHAIQPEWEFTNKQFSEIIPLANKEDIFYCDPPYYGRYVDYYNGWTEEDEELLFNQLRDTEAKFILSTWHHNDYRENEMISKFWNRFNIITRDHFYHSGGKIENRKSIVEALICNFDLDEKIAQHNHGIKEKPKQLSLFELVNENATNVDN
ncbi:MAG: Dam family site-specific DNA-(adenine-N6)-methyltransferase [Bacteroidales bacterium]|jgi:DNA adenine methylase|nr:Dam family site-specific DNA-(adenine-N6)-methyltransferase [Bacteroidales bacterium]